MLPERFCNNLYSYQFLRTFLVALTSGDENPIHLYSLFHPKISHLNPQNLSPQPKPTQAGHLHRTKGTLTQPPSSDAIMLSHKAASALSVSAIRHLGASSVAFSRIASLYSDSFPRSGEDAAHFPGAATHTAKTVSNRPPRIYHYTPSNCRWMSTHVTRDSLEGVFAKDLMSDEFHCMFAKFTITYHRDHLESSAHPFNIAILL